jgi:hypothetical protein
VAVLMAMETVGLASMTSQVFIAASFFHNPIL